MTDLASQVRSELDALCVHPEEKKWGNCGWTLQIKTAIARLAGKANNLAYASGADAVQGGEWLYDLIWLDYSPVERKLSRTILVLECEWERKQSAIEDDFLKLLVARADLRVMVFQVAKAKAWQKLVDRLVGLVQVYQQSRQGDRFLLSGWIGTTRRFDHWEYTHEASVVRISHGEATAI